MSDRETYRSLSGLNRPKAFHEGVWDGYHCNGDWERSQVDPDYKAGVEEGFGRYMCDALL